MVFNWFRRKFDEDATPAKDVAEATPTDDAASEVETETSTDTEADTTIDEVEPKLGQDLSAISESATPNSDVYLEWAKAAFQNIQQRQTTEVTATREAVETVEVAEAAEAVDAIETPVASETEAESIAIEDAPQPTTITETEPSTVTAAENVADSTEIAPEISTEIDQDETVAAAKIAEIAKIKDVSATIAPSIETSAAAPTTPTQPTQPTQPITTSADPDPDPEPEKPSTPAWMRAAAEREARLERLQETAIEASDAFEQLPDRGGVSGELELDEDFIWSAEVLAAQGRSVDDISVEEIEWLTKLRSGLGKTRIGLVNQLKSIVGQGPLNEDAVTEIEGLLLQADVGVDATDAIVEALQAKMREETLPPDEAIAYLKQVLRDMLEQPFERNYDRDFSPVPDLLNIWMMTGVNGAGKTTTIGKLTHLAKSSGYSCLIAAADTFRAAAVEQVKVWGERTQTDVIANPGQNTDPASVVFDAIEAAKARNVNLLLVDTAGRLQNKKNLMDELSKMRRIINTKAPNARIESLLVLDATLGQNGLRQAEVFAEAAQLSGVVLTKLDGSARGGVALAVVRQLGLPIRFIGAGEGIEDLRPFSSYEFVEALLDG